ncbi:MAG: flagellar assembly protein T N-terminal domain-containing protein [Marinobacterium sp.]
MKSLVSALLFLLLLPIQASAVAIEATGQAPYSAADPGQSRQQALKRAMQQASIQAASWLSSTRQVRDGVLEIDTLRLRSLGQVSNVRVIDEKVADGHISVSILADVDIAQGCKDSRPETAYHKSVAVTHFPLERPGDARHGQLEGVQQSLATLLAYELKRSSTFNALDVGELNIIGAPDQAPVRILPEGALTTALEHSEQHNVQYLVSGVIRSLAPHHATGPRESNVLLDLYRQVDYEERYHKRDFVLDLFIHDAFTGTLQHQQRYHMTADWTADSHAKVGFGTPEYWNQPYGKQTRSLIRAISNDIQLQLTCEPFKARITRTRDREVWINAGHLDGLKAGDQLSVYRRFTHYGLDNRLRYELENTGYSLTLRELQPDLARGALELPAAGLNIQRDDIVIAH